MAEQVAASTIVLYIISISGMMLAPFLLARYLAYVWQERMTPFYWGLFVFLAAKVPNIAVLTGIASVGAGHKPSWEALDPRVLQLVNVTAIALLAAFFEEGGRWVFFKAVSMEDKGLKKPFLFGLGWGACEAFFIGFSLAVALILFSISDAGAKTPPLPTDGEATQAPLASREQQSDYLLKGPAYVPFLPLAERAATIPWHILFSLVVFLSVARRKPVYFLVAFAAHFALGFVAGFAAPRGPPNPERALIFEIELLALSIVAWVGIRRLYGHPQNDTAL
jgi:hypothetical protein